MPPSWQNAYLLKGTHISDDSHQMLFYFVQFQSITDNQTGTKTFSASQSLDKEKQYKYICTSHGLSGFFPSSFQSSQNSMDCTLRKNNTNNQELFVSFSDLVQFTPCLPILGWGVCFINSKNKATDGQNC